MTVGTPKEGYQAFLNESPAGIDPQISPWYGDLEKVPGGGHSHALRFLAVARPGDILRLPPRLRSVAEEQVAHFEALGFTVPDGIVYSDRFGATFTGSNADRRPVVFMFDSEAHQLRSDWPRLHTVMQLEDKAEFIRQYCRFGVFPLSVAVASGQPLSYQEVWRWIGRQPGRLKPALGASGEDQVLFKNQSELRQLMDDAFWKGQDYVVQQDVGEFNISLNYYATDAGVYFLFGTDQQNDGPAHEGNFFTTAHDIEGRKITDMLAEVVWSRGMRGQFGFDLRFDPETGRMWVIECNARFTAPMYGWLLARQKQSPWFCVMNLKYVTSDNIAGIVPAEALYSDAVGAGAVVHNAGPLAATQTCSVTVLAQGAEEGADILQYVREYATQPQSLVVPR